MNSEADEWLVGRRYGGWQVDGFLARGGMATVWLVHRERDAIDAVLKVPLGRDEDFLARAAREGRIQSALVHPNVVRALDVVDADGRPGIVLERIGGGLALDGLLRAGRLSETDADAIFAGLLDGVEAAHQAGYIHRDLKPGNVLLAGDRGTYQAKLADFGLARPEHETSGIKLTRAGYIMGSAAYMAPEQARDAATVDASADIWSLGCILYELWTGAPTFPGVRIDDVLVNVCAGRFKPLDTHGTPIPARVTVAVEACLCVTATERPATVAELRELWKGERRWAAGGAPARRSGAGRSPLSGVNKLTTSSNATNVALLLVVMRHLSRLVSRRATPALGCGSLDWLRLRSSRRWWPGGWSGQRGNAGAGPPSRLGGR